MSIKSSTATAGVGAPVDQTLHRRVPALRLGTDRGGAARLAIGALVLLTAVAVIVRLPWFGNTFYGDEVEAFYIVHGHSLGRIFYLLHGHSPELTPPLFFIFAWVSTHLFGTSVQSFRAISLVAGIGLVPLTYLLGRWTFNRLVGVIAAALIALSPFMIFYSTEARPYCLLMTLCLVSTLSLLRAIETRRAGWWIAYAVSACAAVYTHYTGVFLLGIQFVWALATHREIWKPLVASNVAAAIGFAPWVPALITDANSPGTKNYAILGPFTLHNVWTDLEHLWLGLPYVPIQSIPGDVAVVLLLLGLVIAIASCGRLPSLRLSPRPLLVVLLAAGVPLAVALYSGLFSSVWDSRDLITSWPAFAVLVAAITARARPVVRPVAIALVLGAFAIGAIKSLGSQYQRPDYRAAAEYLTRSGAAESAVVEDPDLTPGPVTSLEVAEKLVPGASWRILRLGRAPLAAELRAPPFKPLPLVPGQVVAREAVSMTRSGKVFFLMPGPIPRRAISIFRQSHVQAGPRSGLIRQLAAFVTALPPRFHLVAVHSFPGMHPVMVFTFRG